MDEIAEIAELVGHVNASFGLSTNPTLRRTNRIRTIYSSLAIEQNTLSLEQVTAVLNGKYVIAPPKDIAEVKMHTRSMRSWIRSIHIPWTIFCAHMGL